MNASPVIKIVRLRPDTDSDIPLPRYMTPQSAGMDLCAAIKKDLVLNKGELSLIPTGFAIALPEGFEAQIRPRSGLAIKHGIGLINSPGTVDTDYRGEIKIAVINLGGQDLYLSSRGPHCPDGYQKSICCQARNRRSARRNQTQHRRIRAYR